MKIYKSKYLQLTGTSYDEVVKKARKEHNEIRKRTKRQPYVRSKYYKKDKIFIKLWDHLDQKNRHDRQRRLKLYTCAIDLIRNTTFDPVPKPNPNKQREVVHRFAGESSDGELFFVQIKENIRTGRKDFISVFPGN